MRISGKNVRLHLVKGGTHSLQSDKAEWKEAGELVKKFLKINLR
jgi:hypothetical protein